MSGNTVRSHYLPRTYLKHFLLEDKLVMYMKGEKFFKNPDTKPEDRILTVMGEEGLKNVGLQKHLYNPGVEGITSDDLEEIFRSIFNGNIAQQIFRTQTREITFSSVLLSVNFILMSALFVQFFLIKYYHATTLENISGIFLNISH